MSFQVQRFGDFRGEGDFPLISKMVVHGGLLYTSGIVADPSGDVAQQTRVVLQRLDDLLAMGGSDRTQLLSAQVWLADMADFPAHNAVWDEWIHPEHLPVRACVGAQLYDPGVLVEIRIVAATAGVKGEAAGVATSETGDASA